MDLVGILTVDRYWSEVLCFTIMSEVKVIDFVAKHKTGKQRCPSIALIITYDTGMTLTYIVPMFLCLINCLSTSVFTSAIKF